MTEQQLRDTVQAAIDTVDLPFGASNGHDVWVAVVQALIADSNAPWFVPILLGFKVLPTDQVRVSFNGYNGIVVTHS
jgi:hypothetical protein